MTGCAALQVREVSDALTFVMDNAATYGGDADQVTLFGHSAGAHLCFMALLHRAAAASRTPAAAAPDDGSLCTSDARMPARTLLAAGPYDISKHYEYEERRGVHMLSTMERAIGGWAAFRARSPAVIIASVLNRYAERRAAAVPRLTESASALRPAAGEASGAGATGSGMHAASDSTAKVALAEAAIGAHASGADSEPFAGNEAAEEGAAVLPGVSEVLPEPQVSTGSAVAGEAEGAVDVQARGVKRPRSRGREEPEGRFRSVPDAGRLNPPGRQRFFEMFPLAGDAIAARAGHLSAADAGADVAGGGTGTAVMLDGAAFRADAADPAEGFAAGLVPEDVRRLPPVVLMCSSRDTTVPWHESAEMFHVLRAAGLRSRHLMYDDVAHAGFVMEWRAERDDAGRPAGTDGGTMPEARPRFMLDTIRLVRGEVNV